MPYLLPEDGEVVFPHPKLADDDGLLAIGGDLSVERLLLAYSNGIFPWFGGDGEPFYWYSPDPRMVLFPKDYKPTESLLRIIKKSVFTVKFDSDFGKVIRCCADISRKNEDGTWITEDFIDAYSRLHFAGYAHSVETYMGDELVGGLYGVSLGNMFFGESMFHKVSNASKVAFYFLVKFCLENNFSFIDAQQETCHLKNMGACNIARKEFLLLIKKGLANEVVKW